MSQIAYDLSCFFVITDRSRARYRDLLGTAETIVVMNTEIQEIENKLGKIGRRCNSKAVESNISYLHRFQTGIHQNGMKQSLFCILDAYGIICADIETRL